MFPLTKPRAVAVARCWGLWVRWLRAEKAGHLSELREGRAVLYRLWHHIRKEMEE